MTRFNLSRWAIEHGSFSAFLLVLLLAAGGFSLVQLGQKEDPDFTFRTMVVRVLWPGAPVADMTTQVVDKIERKLQETPRLKYVRSYTKPGVAVVFVELVGEAQPAEIKDAFYQVRKKMGDIRQTLPAGVIGPFFNDEFGDTYIALYAFSGQGFSYPELEARARIVRDQLLRVDGVTKIDVLGAPAKKLWIELETTTLATRGLTVGDIQAAIQAQNGMAPGGAVDTGQRSVRLQVDGDFLRPEDLAELRLRIGSAVIRLGDIATVRLGIEDPISQTIRFQGEDSVVLGVVMDGKANVTKVGARLDAELQAIRPSLPVGLTIGKIADQGAMVTGYVAEFMRTLVEALLIVLAVSFLSLGWRSGIVVALTIPLVLAATFLVMELVGVDLQKISLGALIIALGLLVDDAMIAIEMMQRKLEEGADRLTAASFAFTSTAFPMLTGTLITVAGFLPVGLAQSTAGEYVRSLFVVIGAALMISWIAAVYFTPYIGYHLLKVKPHEGEHEVYDGRFYRAFRKLVEACLRWRLLTIAVTFAALVAGGYGLAIVPKQFFPASNRPEVLVNLWLPEGTSVQETGREARRLESAFLSDKDVKTVTTYIGVGAPRFYLPLDQELQNANFAQLVLVAKDIDAREHVIERARAVLAADFPQIRGVVERLNSGPPVGWAVQIRVLGPDPTEVRRLADQVKDVMRAHPQPQLVHDDWLEPVPSLRLVVDQDRARALGVSSVSIRQAMQAVLTGGTIGEFRFGEDTIDIVVREKAANRDVLTAVEQAYVPTATGTAVPLTQVARVVPVLEPGISWRRDRQPAITVRATLPDGVQSPDVAGEIMRQLQPLRASLAPGYVIEPGGAIESSAESQASILAGFPVMIIAILLLLMIQLQSIGRMLLVLATAPLGIIGASAALIAYGAPFGFVAILGVIALAGMIMRNSIILVDQIEHDIGAGITPFEAIVGSAVRRFRPIMLTAAAAILAMIPLSHSIFWGPMAIAMMGGLAAATVLTLTSFPALYAFVYRVRAPSAAPVGMAVEHAAGAAQGAVETVADTAPDHVPPATANDAPARDTAAAPASPARAPELVHAAE